MFKWLHKFSDWLLTQKRGIVSSEHRFSNDSPIQVLGRGRAEALQKQKIKSYYPIPDSVTMKMESVREKERKLDSEARKLVVAEALRNSDDEFNKIRELAYYKWEAAGRPEGESENFWIAAEKELQLDRAWISMWGL